MIALWLLIGILAGVILGFILGSVYWKGINEKSKAESQAIHKEAIERLQTQFDRTIENLNSRVQAATEEMLKKRQDEFSSSSNDSLNRLLQPLQRNLQEMRDALAANTANQKELGGRLDANLTSLFTQTAATRESAEKLANALKGNNQIQGLWGETVLKELLESQGLQEGKHFEVQTVLSDIAGNTILNAQGNRMRPDVVLHLDRERDLVIDSKVSLSAYLEYVNAQDDDSRSKALERHIRSMENHVAELARKDYGAYKAAGKIGAGFVIMFVPNSPALMLATGSKPDLWRKAMESRVYIADEKTLYAALKIIDLTWQQISQAGNQERVYELAQEMLDRVGRFMESYVDIGNKLTAAQESYDVALKKLKEGGQSIPATCRKLRELGATSSRKPKGVPPELTGLE